MNKIISTSDRLFMAICGPSCGGKTELIFQKLLKKNFTQNLKTFIISNIMSNQNFALESVT